MKQRYRTRQVFDCLPLRGTLRVWGVEDTDNRRVEHDDQERYELMTYLLLLTCCVPTLFHGIMCCRVLFTWCCHRVVCVRSAVPLHIIYIMKLDVICSDDQTLTGFHKYHPNPNQSLVIDLGTRI